MKYLKFKNVCLLQIVFSIFSLKVFAQEMIVVRHAEAIHNVQEIYSSDSKNSFKHPLTAKGEQQAIATGKELKSKHHFNSSKISAVYVSPFLRTQQTAKLILKELGISSDKIITEPLLSEIYMGNLDGKSNKEILPYLDSKKSRHAQAAKYEGETDHEVLGRMRVFLDHIQSKHPHGNVLVVSHGAPTLELLSLLTGEFPGPKLKNAEYRIVSFEK